MKRLCLLCFAALFAIACIVLFHTTITARDYNKLNRSVRPIPNSYIVVLKDDVTDLVGHEVGDIADALTTRYSGTVKNIYRDALKGYSVEMTPEMAARLSRHKWIKYVEEDSEISEQAATQTGATWGISRIDHRRFMWPLDQNYTYNATG